MTLPRPLTGTFTALYTPFLADGRLDLDAWRGLCDRLARAGSGLVPCGTTGETPTLTDDEYVTLVRHAVEVAAGRVPVIAGAGSSSTEKTVATARVAAELGVDAVLVVTPPYNKPPQRSLLAHFRAVADAGVPVVLYNVPGRTGTNMLPETTLALAADPRFIAVKEAAGSVPQMEQLVFGAPAGFSILSGDDALTFPLIALGGHGLVSVAANVAPRPVVALVDALLAQDLVRARALQRALAPLFSALFATANPIPVKHAASLLGHCAPTVRLPLTADAVDEALSKKLAHALELAGHAAETLA